MCGIHKHTHSAPVPNGVFLVLMHAFRLPCKAAFRTIPARPYFVLIESLFPAFPV